METRRVIDYYQDPGHGWIKVRRAELVSLGIDEDITGYSYQDDSGLVYLEEDCDASRFIGAYRRENPNTKVVFNKIHCNGESFIRALPHYEYKDPDEAEVVHGSDIARIYTLNMEKYDNSCIALVANGKEYRMKVSEIHNLINGVAFLAQTKRKHTYLSVI